MYPADFTQMMTGVDHLPQTLRAALRSAIVAPEFRSSLRIGRD